MIVLLLIPLKRFPALRISEIGYTSAVNNMLSELAAIANLLSTEIDGMFPHPYIYEFVWNTPVEKTGDPDRGGR